MVPLLGSNIKVHFAGMEDKVQFACKEIGGVKYSLWSCYKFIAGKKPGDNMKVDMPIFIPKMIEQTDKHVIMDSGLFTMMFGAGKNQPQTMGTIQDWQDKQIEFIKQNNISSTCVECDCQKLLGTEEAWYFRKRMKDKLKNPQINVWHKEDGKKGLDALIEFSDYIAFSVPELRQVYGKNHAKVCRYMVEYTKNVKPEIDIHLLGCTDKKMLHQNRDCTSADSTSWLSGRRYGRVAGHHYTQLTANAGIALEKKYRQQMNDWKRKLDIQSSEKLDGYYFMQGILGVVTEKRIYENICGPQD